MTNPLARVALVTAMVVVCAPTSQAQQHPADAQQEPTWTLGSGRSLTLFPGGDVYPVYIADPHRPTNTIEAGFIAAGGLPDVRGPLTRLAAGGRFGVMSIRPATPAGRWWQVSIEAGLDALFDSRNRLDVVGWDGNYGVTITTASGSPIALKIAVLHISAHLADEYQERTGGPRINYTREELSVGAAWRWSPRGRVYAESGFGYRRGDMLLEPWRVQCGVEYELGAGRRIGRYAAADFRPCRSGAGVRTQPSRQGSFFGVGGGRPGSSFNGTTAVQRPITSSESRSRLSASPFGSTCSRDRRHWSCRMRRSAVAGPPVQGGD